MIINDALALQAQDRSAFLDRACGGDRDLRHEIESLLVSEGAETCLDNDALQFAAESLAQQGTGSLVGRMLGRYQPLALVGKGGMGDLTTLFIELTHYRRGSGVSDESAGGCKQFFFAIFEHQRDR